MGFQARLAYSSDGGFPRAPAASWKPSWGIPAAPGRLVAHPPEARLPPRQLGVRPAAGSPPESRKGPGREDNSARNEPESWGSSVVGVGAGGGIGPETAYALARRTPRTPTERARVAKSQNLDRAGPTNDHRARVYKFQGRLFGPPSTRDRFSVGRPSRENGQAVVYRELETPERSLGSRGVKGVPGVFASRARSGAAPPMGGGAGCLRVGPESAAKGSPRRQAGLCGNEGDLRGNSPRRWLRPRLVADTAASRRDRGASQTPTGTSNCAMIFYGESNTASAPHAV